MSSISTNNEIHSSSALSPGHYISIDVKVCRALEILWFTKRSIQKLNNEYTFAKCFFSQYTLNPSSNYILVYVLLHTDTLYNILLFNLSSNNYLFSLCIIIVHNFRLGVYRLNRKNISKINK